VVVANITAFIAIRHKLAVIVVKVIDVPCKIVAAK